jgi:hypothetical protein
LKDGEDRLLGLALGNDAPRSIRRRSDDTPVFEVHSLRPCRRIGPDGQQRTDAVVELVQKRKGFFDPDDQKAVDEGKIAFAEAKQDFYFRGGCTLVIDPKTGVIRYCIRKSIWSESRLNQERRFRQGDFGDAAGGAYLGPSSPDDENPFRFLHGGS